MAKPPAARASLAPAERVSLRARCLYAVLLRGWAEVMKKKIQTTHQPFKSFAATDLFEISTQALAHPALKSAFTKRERDLIRKRLGSLSHYLVMEAGYRAEPLEILLWSLGFGTDTVPGGTMGKSVFKILQPVRDLSHAPLPLLAKPRLRSAAQLRHQQAICQAWAWRARMSVLPRTISLECLDEKAEDDSTAFLNDVIAARSAACHKQGIIPKLAKGDFAIDRRPFAVVFDEDMAPTPFYEQSSQERLRAINWVLKPRQDWHKASTRTPLGFTIPARFRGDSRFLNGYINPKDDSRWYY